MTKLVSLLLLACACSGAAEEEPSLVAYRDGALEVTLPEPAQTGLEVYVPGSEMPGESHLDRPGTATWGQFASSGDYYLLALPEGEHERWRVTGVPVKPTYVILWGGTYDTRLCEVRESHWDRCAD